VLRGVPGDYTRLSAEVMWRRSFTDRVGQIWTPFASLRGDVMSASIDSQPGVSNFIAPGTTNAARLMPAVGLEYRYPWINAQPWGTMTIEPIAQIIARPNEPHAGRLPNEDAQSLSFDDSNLFSVDKFSGWDRVEGGGRANVGVQATAQFDHGGSVSALFGQSYHLFGLNSYSIGSLTNTGLNSGLETNRSDYVARISFQPNSTYNFTTRARFDEATMDVQRFEAEGTASFNRWSVSMMYGNYAAQPDIGFLTRRHGLLGTGSIKLDSNWVVTGGARWDIDNEQIYQYIVGAGYVDDCFVLGLNYVTDYTYANQVGGAPPRLSHTVMVRLGLRTLGTNSVSMTPPSQ
jgi:LPS-assembly protein